MSTVTRSLSLFAAVLLTANLAWGRGTVHVRDYYRKDGTHVRAYDRSAPGTSSGASAYTPATSGSSISYTPESSSAPRFIAAPNPALDPNWVPAKIVSGQYVAGHYKADEIPQAAPAATHRSAAPATTISSSSGFVPRLSHSSSKQRRSITSPWSQIQPAQQSASYLKPPHYNMSSLPPAPQVTDQRWYTDSDGTQLLERPARNDGGESGSTHHERQPTFVGERDSHGRLKRSEAGKREFMRMTGHPNGWPGHVVDHIIPLKRGGADDPSNMQWQTVEEAKAKDKWE